MNCLLCDELMGVTPSWQALIAIEKSSLICEDCSKMFKRVDIKDSNETISHIHSLYAYNEGMRTYIHQYKFLQDVALAAVFAGDLQVVLQRKDALIVPIPMHPQKKIERTFAQIDELLHAARIPFEDVLVKTNTEVMGEKTRDERLAMSPLFTMKQGIAIREKTYILVDDIYTTGTTLQHAATVLKNAGVRNVEAVTLVRA